MGLKEYKAKRKFNNTPEPEGKVQKKTGVLRFVIQKHQASHLHYDFRLEMEGVLRSWAVPKGPSLNTTDKRLAMQVEDHPIEYGEFEGIIPPGNYGAGTVMLWDEGTYEPYEINEGEDPEKALIRDWHKGNMKIVLKGKKVKGAFALVKTAGGKGNQWLLIKKKDKFVTEEDIALKDKSVRTKRSLDQIAAQSGEGDSVWSSTKQEKVEVKEGKKSAFLKDVKPMMATLVDAPFNSTDWIYEIKWDGFRAVAEVNYNKINIYSRNLLSFNEQFPEVVNALNKLGIKAVLDGEIVAYDKNGKVSFQAIQNYKSDRTGNVKYYVFDLLYYEGRDLRDLPLIQRKEILKKILPSNSVVIYNEHYEKDGVKFYNAAKEQDLEGIIAKKSDSLYKTGVRSKEWLKIKTHRTQDVVIGGFTEPSGSRTHLGALVVGIYENGKLIHTGQVGGGFDEKGLKKMYELLKPLKQKECPFENCPKTRTKVSWVKPSLVAEVKFQEFTNEGILRQPVFLRLRDDKKPEDVFREVENKSDKVTKEVSKKESKTSKNRKPVRKSEKIEATKPQKIHGKETSGKIKWPDPSSVFDHGQNELLIEIDGNPLKLTNMNKIYWEEEGYTKRNLLEYYFKIAPFILPYLKDRPESLRRNPNGYKGQSFFQKNMPDTLPPWIPTQAIYSGSNDEDINYMLCQDVATLLYMANLGCIEINPWNSRIQKLDYPDFIVIDLDPRDVPFHQVVESALAVKQVLDEIDVDGFPKTSGSKGIHIYIPLGAKYDYDQAKQFAELIAIKTNRLVPDFTSLERMPAKRKNKVYLDYLQNRKGQTLAAPYCVRPKPGATVSTPLEWNEINENLNLADFTIDTIFKRIEEKGDLFLPVLSHKGAVIEKVIEQLK